MLKSIYEQHQSGKLQLLFIFCVMSLPLSSVSAVENMIEKKFIEAGLVDIHTVDPTIQVNLVNSSAQKNFFRQDMYAGLEKAYLREAVAVKLSQAQKILQEKHPGYSLLIMDAARPLSVSQKMYDRMQGTKFERYVANPKTGSMHNYGIAVDVTIVDDQGERLGMGVIPFYTSNFGLYWSYAIFKVFGLSADELANQTLLAETMHAAGFDPIRLEWWHFNGTEKSYARATWDIIP